MSGPNLITLHVGGEEILVEIEIGHDYVRDRGVRPPYAAIRVRGKCPLVLMIEPSLLKEPREREEVLLYAAPRKAEQFLPSLLSSLDSPSFDQIWEPVATERGDDLKAVKESTGETYEQRSRICFEDVCKIAVRIWRDPLARSKEFDLSTLRTRVKKRRIYEDLEWLNVIKWGEGEGYWSHNPNSSAADSMRISGAKIRQLEDHLRGASLGILPEIVGRVEVAGGLTFLEGSFRDSVERDCKEINEAAKVGAAKAVILLCGSVVEALLYERLKDRESDAKQKAKQLGLPVAKEPMNRWAARPIIAVARKLLPEVVSADAEAYSDVLRDYRNLIHAGKDERSERSVDQYTAAIAIQVVNLLIAGIKKNVGGVP